MSGAQVIKILPILPVSPPDESRSSAAFFIASAVAGDAYLPAESTSVATGAPPSRPVRQRQTSFAPQPEKSGSISEGLRFSPEESITSSSERPAMNQRPFRSVRARSRVLKSAGIGVTTPSEEVRIALEAPDEISSPASLSE